MRLALLDQEYQECLAANIKCDPDNFKGLEEVLKETPTITESIGKRDKGSSDEEDDESDNDDAAGYECYGGGYQQLNDSGAADNHDDTDSNEQINDENEEAKVETSNADEKEEEPEKAFKAQEDLFHQSFAQLQTANNKWAGFGKEEEEGGADEEGWFDFQSAYDQQMSA